MQIHIYKTPELAAKAAATLIAAAILAKNDAVIGLPTGSSPVAAYRELARMNKEGVIDFSRVTTFNLDEYIGLAGDHPQSYRHFMDENLFDHINIAKENTHVPAASATERRTHAPMRRPSPLPAASTCNLWALAAMGTLASTSRLRLSATRPA